MSKEELEKKSKEELIDLAIKLERDRVSED